ncbi:hypothetical protein EYD45_02635 [Hyunsoonleella flava]|uniref:FKBP-type peptidyl-prolyl cis-trans isomerase FkpA n=1 Tax=Hyunsoonleella flava TaxID=2527939 RepID=A0A4Q9FLZ8_9FLAO|nr:hypothetical protein [Hyunsoonleella flava]TBN06800.1 hypothetical protein EYD45_02635 [Hyunsoonleella flava]
MRRLSSLLLSYGFLVIFSCSDGDVIDFEFDFDDTFVACGEVDLLLYKTKEDPSETVSVLISSYTLDDIFEEDPDNDSLVIPKPNVRFTYRTYDRPDLPKDLFCSSVPPEGLNIVVDQNDATAVATIIRTFTEDDNDGIPAELENQDPNGDGDFSDAQDTDNDGIPDYLDQDDDGDNVLTANENPDPDGNGDLSDAQDTDGNGTPDYLDSDDDGDGVLTRDEETDTQDQNPLNDITNSDIGADYLNPSVTTSTPAMAYKEHSISRTFVVRLVVSDIRIDFLSQDEFDFGILTGESKLSGSTEITPDFP